ncbi:hypothetical protein KA005_43525, partial [bacterium]|nr:hypothetical protein [bacterium]
GEPEFERANTEIALINKEVAHATRELNHAQKELELAKQEEQEIEEADRVAQGDIHVNESINDAEWSDLFRGTLVSNFRVVEIAKVQMFFFTVVIVFSYAALVWGMLGDTMALRAATVQLPSFSGSFTALLGISHAGYLAVKQTQS